MKSSTPAAARVASLEHFDPHWAWHHAALLRLRQRLLHADAGHSGSSTPQSAAGPPASHHRSSHEAVLAELVAPERRLPEIDMALARIRARSYGICEATGAPIPAARLQAMPWTRFAVPAPERSARSLA